MEADDLFCNTGDAIYIKLRGAYFQRIVGQGWSRLDPLAVPAVNWHKMLESQRAAYTDALAKEDLLPAS